MNEEYIEHQNEVWRNFNSLSFLLDRLSLSLKSREEKKREETPHSQLSRRKAGLRAEKSVNFAGKLESPAHRDNLEYSSVKSCTPGVVGDNRIWE